MRVRMPRAGPAKRAGRVARELTLWVGAVLGALCLLAVVVAPLVGLRPLIFLSGSMSPTITAGSLGIARDTAAADLAVGDIVTVRYADAWVTHRIVEIEPGTDGAALLRLKGDANREVDGTAYPVTGAPRTVVWVPGLGRVIAWLTTPPGVFVLAGYVMLLLGLLRGPRAPSAPAAPPSPPAPSDPATSRQLATRRRGLLAWAAGAVGAAVALPVLVPGEALAAWADSVTVSGTTLTTVTPAAPVVSCGLLNIGSTQLTWTAVPNVTGYRLSYGSGGGTTEDVGPGTHAKTFSGVTAGTFSVQALYGSTWISSASNSKGYTSLLGLLGTCA